MRKNNPDRLQTQLLLWLMVDLVGTAIAAAGFYKLVAPDAAFLPGASPPLLFVVGGILILLSFVQIIRVRLKLKKPATDDK